MIIVRNLENQYEEKLYSTGDDYLDEMLEKAFCEGYEYAQREFASIRQTKKGFKNLIEGNIFNNPKKIAIGTKQLRLLNPNQDIEAALSNRAKYIKK